MASPAVERVLAALDAELVTYVRWRGGDLDRLLDRAHAAMNEQLVQALAALGWTVEPEVSFSELGDRGSIDILAWHADTGTLLVIEVKTELASIEETLRRHDVKARLATHVARQRLGWEARSSLRILVLPDSTASRERVGQHDALFSRAYPLRGAALRRVLKDPAAPGRASEDPSPRRIADRSASGIAGPRASGIAGPSPRGIVGPSWRATSESRRGGLWFLRVNDQARTARRIAGPKRVQGPSVRRAGRVSGSS